MKWNGMERICFKITEFHISEINGFGRLEGDRIYWKRKHDRKTQLENHADAHAFT